MKFKLNRNTLLKLTNDEILELLNSITKFDLYSMSTNWRNSDEYILKCKGANGDVLVYWN